MAGGKGVRLRPLTYDIPKPMIKIAGKPLLEHTIGWAKSQGIKDIIICSGYLSHIIEKFFEDGSNFGVNIKYSIEKKPLGTGGPLGLIKDQLKEDFIVLSGDIFCKLNMNNLMKFHKEKNSDATVVMQEGSHPEESDLIETDKNGKITKFWLKPHNKNVPKIKETNASMYVLNSKILKHIPLKNFSLERELLPFLKEEGYNVYGYNTKELIEDLGSFDRIKKIENLLNKTTVKNNIIQKETFLKNSFNIFL